MEHYVTKGVCAKGIDFELDKNNVVTHVKFIGGCAGNTVGVAKLAIGRHATDVIKSLEGIQCRAGTSCPDQLAQALKAKLG